MREAIEAALAAIDREAEGLEAREEELLRQLHPIQDRLRCLHQLQAKLRDCAPWLASLQHLEDEGKGDDDEA